MPPFLEHLRHRRGLSFVPASVDGDPMPEVPRVVAARGLVRGRMKYAMLDLPSRERLLLDLESMPEFLAREFLALPPETTNRAEPDGSFSPVEHCWHLADLELEGYTARIERLLGEDEPLL